MPTVPTRRAAPAAAALLALAACAAGPGLPGTAPAATSAAPAASAGTMDVVTVHGPSLEGNLEGDSADRTVYVYLPPGYAAHPRKRYPVVYNLHGYSLSAERWVGILGAPAAFDRAEAAAGREMIVVSPDALTVHGGSMYSSSATTGDWESFVAKDLVAYVDSHYRTIAEPGSRGLTGHSMGGYGTLRIAMKHPGVFSSIYAMSGCCLSARGVAPTDADLEKIASMEAAGALGMGGRTTFAASAAWASNPAAPPFYADLPTKDGKPRADVLARYDANAPNVMMHQYLPALRSYEAIALDVGDDDVLLADNTAMHEELSAYGITHAWAVYDGDHVNRIPQRFETEVLPFFASHLD